MLQWRQCQSPPSVPVGRNSQKSGVSEEHCQLTVTVVTCLAVAPANTLWLLGDVRLAAAVAHVDLADGCGRGWMTSKSVVGGASRVSERVKPSSPPHLVAATAYTTTPQYQSFHITNYRPISGSHARLPPEAEYAEPRALVLGKEVAVFCISRSGTEESPLPLFEPPGSPGHTISG